MHRLVRLFARNDAGCAPKIVRHYDPDWDGDEDQPGMPDIDVENGAATIYVYGMIGGWDAPVTELLCRRIAALKVSTIHVRINSPGGMVFESVAIQTALEQNKARKIVHIDGLAASAASQLMLCGDEIEIAPGGFVMIHDPETLCFGDADEMRSSADLLDSVKASIVAQYRARTGLSDAALGDMMEAETWLNAEQAVQMKFCDRVATKAPAPANLRRFDLSAWKNAPADLLKPAAPARPAMIENLAAQREHALARLRLVELNA